LKQAENDINQTRIDEFLTEIERFRQGLLKSRCPSCQGTGLKLISYTKGQQGWSAKIFCLVCGTRGELNNTGFNIELSEATTVTPPPKKTREKKKK
jgi:hypothetical protein